MASVWDAEWEHRIRVGVRELGYPDVNAFLAANPGSRYDDLVRQLRVPAAPVQLAALSLRDAANHGQLRTAAMDSLCRYLAGSLPAGLTQTERGRFGVAAATTMWTTDVVRAADDDQEIEDYCEAVVKGLLALPARPKWLPKTPDDPQLVKLFSSAWPLDRS